MTNAEAVNWLINITADIGKAEHSDLWHYEQALSEIREMLENAQPQLEICPIYGGMCGYPSNLCYECPRHEGAKEQPQWWTEGLQPFAQPQRTCVNCGRTVNNGGWYADGGTRCPIEEHYALPKDGFCHLWEKRNVTDDDYPERQEVDGEPMDDLINRQKAIDTVHAMPDFEKVEKVIIDNLYVGDKKVTDLIASGRLRLVGFCKECKHCFPPLVCKVDGEVVQVTSDRCSICNGYVEKNGWCYKFEMRTDMRGEQDE